MKRISVKGILNSNNALQWEDLTCKGAHPPILAGSSIYYKGKLHVIFLNYSGLDLYKCDLDKMEWTHSPLNWLDDYKGRFIFFPQRHAQLLTPINEEQGLYMGIALTGQLEGADASAFVISVKENGIYGRNQLGKGGLTKETLDPSCCFIPSPVNKNDIGSLCFLSRKSADINEISMAKIYFGFKKYEKPAQLMSQLLLLFTENLRLQNSSNSNNNNKNSFFKIAQKIPLELQYFLCMLVFRRYNNEIPSTAIPLSLIEEGVEDTLNSFNTL